MAEPTLHAFPMGDPTHGGNDGMTLRDWFAGQALAVTLKNDYDHGLAAARGDVHDTKAAAHAYRIADAMLQERSKGRG